MEFEKQVSVSARRRSKARKTSVVKAVAVRSTSHKSKRSPWSPASVRRASNEALAKALLKNPPDSYREFKEDMLRVLARVRDLTPTYEPQPRAKFRPRVAPKLSPTDLAIEESRSRGLEQVKAWIDEGLLIGSQAFADRWGVRRQTIDAALKRGDLFCVTHARRHYLLEGLSRIASQKAYAIVRDLGAAEGPDKLLWWIRPHGALGNRSPVDVLTKAPKVPEQRLRELAQAWAEEHGLIAVAE